MANPANPPKTAGPVPAKKPTKKPTPKPSGKPAPKPTKKPAKAPAKKSSSGKKKGGGNGGVDSLQKQQMAANYGFALAFLKSDKELWNLFSKAVQKTWTPQMFVARLRDTKWFQKHSADVRNAILQQKSDPATYKANLDKMYANVKDEWGKLFGEGLDIEDLRGVDDKSLDDTLHRWAETAFRMGWSEQQLLDTMTESVRYQQAMRQNQLGGTAGELSGQLDQLTSAYGVDFGDLWKSEQIKNLLSGQGTVGGVQNIVRETAKQQYQALAADIDAGRTVAEIADPYAQKMADLLEINPQTLTPKDGLIQKALTMKDQNGVPSVMNLRDFENEVRKDNRWQYTNNAKQQVASVTANLLQAFGLLG